MRPPPILPVFFLILLFSFAQTQPTSDDEVRLGIEAYKNSHYDDAMQHFEKAKDQDGSNLKARLYLATACISQYIPGVDSPENNGYAEKAIEQYQYILDAGGDPEQRINSAKGIGYLFLNMKQFEVAKKYYRIASDLDPKDPEPYYSIGVIDWTVCYQPRMEARTRLGMRPDQHLNRKIPEQKKICDDLSAKNLSVIEEGMDALNQAIELRPEYDDAMAYMNLMYRERADLECYDPAARERDQKAADEWVDKTLLAKKAKAERAETPAKPPSD